MVFTNNERLIKGIDHEVNIDLSDHNTLALNMAVYPGQVTSKSNKKDFYLTDLHSLDMRRSTEAGVEKWALFTQLMDGSDWSIPLGACGPNI